MLWMVGCGTCFWFNDQSVTLLRLKSKISREQMNSMMSRKKKNIDDVMEVEKKESETKFSQSYLNYAISFQSFS